MKRADDWADEAARRLIEEGGVPAGTWPALIKRIAAALRAERAATAARCAEIAEEVAGSYVFPSEHAVGAETVAASIRREFPAVASRPWPASATAEAGGKQDHLNPLATFWAKRAETAEALNAELESKERALLVAIRNITETLSRVEAERAELRYRLQTWNDVHRERAERDATHYQHYYSTYCIHGNHVDCRLTCKTCKAPCLCECHGATGEAGGKQDA